MPQTWIVRSSRKVFLVDQNDQEGLSKIIKEEFESSKNPVTKEETRALLEPGFPQNPQLN
jgi:hypothetical protein